MPSEAIFRGSYGEYSRSVFLPERTEEAVCYADAHTDSVTASIIGCHFLAAKQSQGSNLHKIYYLNAFFL